jgi:hypothetical protein
MKLIMSIFLYLTDKIFKQCKDYQPAVAVMFHQFIAVILGGMHCILLVVSFGNTPLSGY